MQVYKYKVEGNLQKKVDRGCLLRHLLGPPEVDEERAVVCSEGRRRLGRLVREGIKSELRLPGRFCTSWMDITVISPIAIWAQVHPSCKRFWVKKVLLF